MQDWGKLLSIVPDTPEHGSDAHDAGCDEMRPNNPGDSGHRRDLSTLTPPDLGRVSVQHNAALRPGLSDSSRIREYLEAKAGTDLGQQKTVINVIT